MQQRFTRGLALFLLLSCTDNSITAVVANRRPACEEGNAGLVLPAGFCALVVTDIAVHDQLVRALDIVVTPHGDIFVASSGNTPGIIGLRDTRGDGHADQQTHFSAMLGGSSIAWRNGTLYLGADDRVVAFALPDAALAPAGGAEVVVSGLPNSGDHVSKPIVVGMGSMLFVGIGAASNSCQVSNRLPQSPGVFPCPELATRAGVWSFDATGRNQTLTNGHRYVSGYGNLVALDINPADNSVAGVQPGREMLGEDWPRFFSAEQDAAIRRAELVNLTNGSAGGWPYCFTSSRARVLAPEYGGDGSKTSGGTSPIDCAAERGSGTRLGAAGVPSGMHFYRGNQFPPRYHRGAFVSMRAGFEPSGRDQVMFLPMDSAGAPAGTLETFATGFETSTGMLSHAGRHRPGSVTEGPDGSLYIADDKGGRIWRIIYRPDFNSPARPEDDE